MELSFQIMTGNKRVIRVVVYVLIVCLLLGGCSGKIDAGGDNATGYETVSSTGTDLAGTTEITSPIDDEKDETQTSTKPQGSTMSDDEFTTEDSVPSTEPSEKPTDSSTVTIPTNGNDDTLNTEPPTTPTDNTATSPEKKENDMPDYGIELPDDNWD